MGIQRALNRTLWFEALYDAFPNRFTLWLWARAGNKLRAIRDGGFVKARGQPDPGSRAKARRAQKQFSVSSSMPPEEFWRRMDRGLS